MFWWEFLVGDTPEIFIGTIVVLGGVLALGKGNTVSPYLLVLLVCATVATSVWVEMKRTIKRARK